MTRRNHLDVKSYYERVWNFNTDEVCLSAVEGQYNKDNAFVIYIDNDKGCYEIPENQYAKELKAGLAPG